nr:hypothetical protein BaRGS_000684 [Batillaria attramentaria]
MMSDLLIAIDKPSSPRFPSLTNLIMITYYAAQLGVALSVVDSQVEEVIRIQTRGQDGDVIDNVKGQLQYWSGHLSDQRSLRGGQAAQNLRIKETRLSLQSSLIQQNQNEPTH